MYFPVGWPKALNLAPPGEDIEINHICSDAVKILIAVVGDNFLGIWYANPLIPIVFNRRSEDSLSTHGKNVAITWKPDSRQLLVLTEFGRLILYQIYFDPNQNGIFIQVDSPASFLKRESAELYIQENIPRLSLRELRTIILSEPVTTVCCFSLSELLMATKQCKLIATEWETLALEGSDDAESNMEVINLRNVPFYLTRGPNLKGIPQMALDSCIVGLEYSPFIGGCAAIFNNNTAAFLLVSTQQRCQESCMHGFWITDAIEDASLCSVNHKFRLLAYGCTNSQVVVFSVDDANNSVQFSHRLSMDSMALNSNALGAVSDLKWSPDGCVLAVAWQNGGISLWSTFGALLMSTLNWDFNLNVDLMRDNPLRIRKLEWSTEGYQLLMTCHPGNSGSSLNSGQKKNLNVMQLNFLKSAMSVNPYTTFNSHVLLQGDNTLYLNQGNNLAQIYFQPKFRFPNNTADNVAEQDDDNGDDVIEIKKSVNVMSILSESKCWSVLQLPTTYGSSNWPIRYSAIDTQGLRLAVAGRSGIAHYSMQTRKWKLFGNESQEKDFVVSGGLLWWNSVILMGCYSLLERTDEIRFYFEESKLDNQFCKKISMDAPVTSLNIFRNQLITLTGDGVISLFVLKPESSTDLHIHRAYDIDVKNICIHPACIISLTATNLRYSRSSKSSPIISQGDLAETIIVNVCGRVLMIYHDTQNSVVNSLTASCLASSVEYIWISNAHNEVPMRNCLCFFSGSNGMSVWLPVIPPLSEQEQMSAHCLHAFMSKRIMLTFPLKLHPLVILFDNVIVLGVETSTTLYSTDTNSYFSLPFCWLERKSEVYLHKVLRQLIKRNLGYSAWEIAKSCRSLPYFPHALELLLHEVLEEEATSKEPIPDALLPSILDFIKEFPVYLQTIVQCARKTEIALWPHLFSIAGKPKDLFQQCFNRGDIETAASYLIILQSLEPSFISKHYATLLLDIALQNHAWELAKELIRFLKAIDPNEIDSPRSSLMVNMKIVPPSNAAQTQVNSSQDVFNLVLGPIARDRGFSVNALSNVGKEKKDKANVVTPSSIVTTNSGSMSAGLESLAHKVDRSLSQDKGESKESFCIETILKRHACTLLKNAKLLALGYMNAFLDFHLVTWLSEESQYNARLDDFVVTLMALHNELGLPSPKSPKLSNIYLNEASIKSSLSHDLISNRTSESGYGSLALKNPESLSFLKTVEDLDTDFHDSTANSSVQISPEKSWYSRMLSMNDPLGVPPFQCVGGIGAAQNRLPKKMEVKIRYLLQLFVEANCTDYALILSILLQDTASIGRIINSLIRSESLKACKDIYASLKRLTQWSYSGECVYSSFMTGLQPYIYLLDQFITAYSHSHSASTAKSHHLDNEAIEKDDLPAASNAVQSFVDTLNGNEWALNDLNDNFNNSSIYEMSKAVAPTNAYALGKVKANASHAEDEGTKKTSCSVM